MKWKLPHRPDPLITYLRERRINYAITVTELAKVMGISHNQLCRLEYERQSPSLFTLRVWCDALGVDITPSGIAEPRRLPRRETLDKILIRD